MALTITGSDPGAASMAVSQWSQLKGSSGATTTTETTVLPAEVTAQTDANAAQQGLGKLLPIVIGTGRVDGVYFIGGVEAVSTVTTETTTTPNAPPDQTIVVVGSTASAASEAASQLRHNGYGNTVETTETTETQTLTKAGYVLAYDAFERGYNLIRLEVDGDVVYDIEAGIPAATTFRFYGGRHSSTDAILTEVIGANTGAYKNFVMVFIDGYPADSPPGVSAVISNSGNSGPEKTTLQSIITDVMFLAGFGSSDLTFEGIAGIGDVATTAGVSTRTGDASTAGSFVLGDDSGYVWHVNTDVDPPTIEQVDQIGTDDFGGDVGRVDGGSFAFVESVPTFVVCGRDYQDTGEGLYIDGVIMSSHDGRNWERVTEWEGSQGSEWIIPVELVWDPEDQKFYAWVHHRSAFVPGFDYVWSSECWASPDGYEWDMIDQIGSPGGAGGTLNPVFESHCKFQWVGGGSLAGKGFADGKFGFNPALTTFDGLDPVPAGSIVTDPETSEVGHLVTQENVDVQAVTFGGGTWGQGNGADFLTSTDDARTWQTVGSIDQPDPSGTNIITVIGGMAGIEITGYGFVIASDTTIQSAMRSLSDIYGFTWCDTGSGFFIKKAAQDEHFAIDAAIDAVDIVERPQPVLSSDDADIRTPSSVEMEYVSKEGGYKSRPVSFNMTTGVLNSITTPRLSSPILLDDAEAQRIVTEKFFEYHEKRREHSLVVGPENIVLLPGDIISFPSGGTTYIARVEGIGIDLRNMGVEISARDFQTEVATDITAISNNPPVWQVVYLASEYVHLDMPLLRYQDDTAGASLVQYGALMPKGADLWSGATLYRSPPTTIGFAAIFDQLPHAGVRGVCLTVLPAPADPFALDDSSTLTIRRITANTTLLVDATEEEVLAGVNNALVGINGRWEWVGYKTVADNGDGTYTLSGFTLRGYRGSEVFCGSHAVDDVFIMIDDGWVHKMMHSVADLDDTFYYKAPGLGQSLSYVAATTHTIPGAAETPYAPTGLKADEGSPDGIDISWDYRSRITTGFNPAEHGEAALAFEVDIYDTDGTTYIRTLTTATNSVHYASADVIADFGSDPPSECFFRVYMMSALPIFVAGQDRPVAGRGYEARGHFPTVALLLSGDMQSGTDHVKLSGDAVPGNLLLTEE
jgi:hypothetical protein